MEKNEREKVKEGKEHIFKLDMQGEISNKQLLISNRLHENVKEHRYRNTHSHNLSCMYVCTGNGYIGKVTGTGKTPKMAGSHQVERRT